MFSLLGDEASAKSSCRPSEVSLICKQLRKRDSVTRAKGLQALCTFVRTAGAEERRQLLSFFVKQLQTKLLHDDDIRVRQACVHAIDAFAAERDTLRSELARLIGPWQMLAEDPAVEVSRAGKRSLDLGFGADRRAVLSLYSAPALSYWTRTLEEHAAQPSDEDETTVRLAVCSLRSAGSYLAALGQERNEAVRLRVPSLHERLLRQTAERVRRRPEDALLRRTAFQALGAFLEHLPACVPSTEAFASPLLSAALHEEDENVSPAAWNTFVRILSNDVSVDVGEVEEAPISTNRVLRKEVCPLARRGFGSVRLARIAAPLMLPLASATLKLERAQAPPPEAQVAKQLAARAALVASLISGAAATGSADLYMAAMETAAFLSAKEREEKGRNDMRSVALELLRVALGAPPGNAAVEGEAVASLQSMDAGALQLQLSMEAARSSSGVSALLRASEYTLRALRDASAEDAVARTVASCSDSSLSVAVAGGTALWAVGSAGLCHALGSCLRRALEGRGGEECLLASIRHIASCESLALSDLPGLLGAGTDASAAICDLASRTTRVVKSNAVLAAAVHAIAEWRARDAPGPSLKGRILSAALDACAGHCLPSEEPALCDRAICLTRKLRQCASTEEAQRSIAAVFEVVGGAASATGIKLADALVAMGVPLPAELEASLRRLAIAGQGASACLPTLLRAAKGFDGDLLRAFLRASGAPNREKLTPLAAGLFGSGSATQRLALCMDAAKLGGPASAALALTFGLNTSERAALVEGTGLLHGGASAADAHGAEELSTLLLALHCATPMSPADFGADSEALAHATVDLLLTLMSREPSPEATGLCGGDPLDGRAKCYLLDGEGAAAAAMMTNAELSSSLPPADAFERLPEGFLHLLSVEQNAELALQVIAKRIHDAVRGHVAAGAAPGHARDSSSALLLLLHAALAVLASTLDAPGRLLPFGARSSAPSVAKGQAVVYARNPLSGPAQAAEVLAAHDDDVASGGERYFTLRVDGRELQTVASNVYLSICTRGIVRKEPSAKPRAAAAPIVAALDDLGRAALTIADLRPAAPEPLAGELPALALAMQRCFELLTPSLAAQEAGRISAPWERHLKRLQRVCDGALERSAVLLLEGCTAHVGMLGRFRGPAALFDVLRGWALCGNGDHDNAILGLLLDASLSLRTWGEQDAALGLLVGVTKRWFQRVGESSAPHEARQETLRRCLRASLQLLFAPTSYAGACALNEAMAGSLRVLSSDDGAFTSALDTSASLAVATLGGVGGACDGAKRLAARIVLHLHGARDAWHGAHALISTPAHAALVGTGGEALVARLVEAVACGGDFIYGRAAAFDVLRKLVRGGSLASAADAPSRLSTATRVLGLEATGFVMTEEGSVKASLGEEALEALDDEAFYALEESAEALSDVASAVRFLPAALLDRLEGFRGNGAAPLDAFGTICVFLLFLEAADAADKLSGVAKAGFRRILDELGVLEAAFSLAFEAIEANARLPKAEQCEAPGTPRLLSLCGVCAKAGERPQELLVGLSVLAVFRTLRVLPARGSQWWTKDCPRRMKNMVRRFVEESLAADIAYEEMRSLREGDLKDDAQLRVKCSSVSREVTITYVHEDCSADVVISLPDAYPLRTVEVKSESRLGLSEAQWRRWTLQIVTLLGMRDGTILDAVRLWKKHLDKAFEGVEPCPICYSTLHFKTLSLPNVTCGTCRNKFHGPCLYKWFSTSRNASCPMCRSVGSFTNARASRAL